MRSLRRIAAAFASLLLVGVATFALLELVPGDASATLLGVHATPIAQRELRRALDLEGSTSTRALRYLGHIARLDLGRSLVDGRSVRALIAERLPRTLFLSLVACTLAWLLALLLAARRARAIDLGLALLYAVPLPSLALVLLSAGAPYAAPITSSVFAALCLLPLLVPRVHGQLVRALDDAHAHDALRTLRAIGAPPARLYRAALRLQALPLATLAALQLPALLSGAVLVEAIFGLPGLGMLAFDGLANRDAPVLLGLVLVGACVTIGCTLFVDLIAARLDPRVDA